MADDELGPEKAEKAPQRKTLKIKGVISPLSSAEQKPGKPGGLAGDSAGFAMSVMPGTRRVPGYPVTKDELERISEANTQAQGFYALGAFFGSFAISTLLDGALSSQLTPAGQIVNLYGPWMFGIVAAAFFFFGWRTSVRRRRLIDDITDQTTHAE